jgi:tRNA pseudouridine38-40 synthase
MKFKLFIAYDGTHYGGWQIQTNATSIQTLVENALSTALRTPTSVTASGRTDAGVHALHQVAHFSYEHELDLYRLIASLNGLLPLDIRVLNIEPTSDDFHARYSAKSKIYHYHLHLDRVLDPFKRLYSFHVLHPVDLELLQKSANLFIGTHDFTSFANEADQGSAAKNPIRTLYRLDIIEERGGVRLEFEGSGFLYKMVRNITGTLLDIANCKLDVETLPDIFAAKNRSLAGKAAPAQGLFLVKVNYV